MSGDGAMTEDEAKTKWCPFARVDSGFAGAGVCNRYPMRDPEGCDTSRERVMVNDTVRCIASSCMAWRWDVPSYPGNGGSCGLAGKP